MPLLTLVVPLSAGLRKKTESSLVFKSSIVFESFLVFESSLAFRLITVGVTVVLSTPSYRTLISQI